MTPQQRIIIFICVAIFAVGQFHRASGGVFTPVLMDRFAVSAATVGGLVSAMFFATIIAQVPFGSALDRFGPRPVLTLCMSIIAVGTAIFAFAQNFDAVLMSRVLIGVGLAAMGAASHLLIARHFTGANFGYISGLVVTLGGIGGLVGTYPLAMALDLLAWHIVFGSVAAVPVGLAAFVFMATATGTDGQAETGEAPASSQTGYLALLKMAEFQKILVLGIVTYAPITTITGLWGGPFLQDVIGLSSQSSGAVLFLLFAATIVAGYVFGVLDRHLRSRRVLILSAAATSTLCLTALAVLAAPPTFLAVGLLTLMVFCQQFYIPLGAHMRRVVPMDMIGRAATLLSVFSVAAIPLMQIGFGFILDRAAEAGGSVDMQYRAGFTAMAVLIAACAAVYAFARQVDNTPD